jgi:hypothetical protein
LKAIKVRSSKEGNDTSLKLGWRPLLGVYLYVLEFDDRARQAISRTWAAAPPSVIGELGCDFIGWWTERRRLAS